MNENIFGVDPNNVLKQAYPAFLDASERWDELTADDDGSTDDNKKDIRTVVSELAQNFSPDDDCQTRREIVAESVEHILDNYSDAAELAWLASVFHQSYVTVNEAAKYAVRQDRPDTPDVDEDLVTLHAELVETRNYVNLALKMAAAIGQNFTAQNVKKDGKGRVGTIDVDGLEIPVRVGANNELTVKVRLPNAPGTESVGRPVAISTLKFIVTTSDGLEYGFTPRRGVATQHLAWHLNTLGCGVPAVEKEFLPFIEKMTGSDFFKTPWTAEFPNGVKLRAEKND